MIRLKRSILRGIASAKRKEDLYTYLQDAVELEHATIPPYLTAMYSLKPDTNCEIKALIRSIVIEEMLHMTISANILVAIGGSPQINCREFIPNYPGPLPMGVDNDLIVGIMPFSKELVKDVFMAIESPETPIPIDPPTLAAEEEEYATIGLFYAAIEKKIVELGDSIFVVGPERQVLSWFNPHQLFPIVDVATAIKGIEIIVIQGEGTHSQPYDAPGQPAHYYRFGEIYYGRKIIKTPDGYAYNGAPVPFDAADVYPMIANPSPDDYAPGSQAELRSNTFSYGYSCLLNALHESFNGAPQKIDAAMGLMYQLRLQAQTLMSTPVKPGSSETAGPVYRYVTSQ
jgi:hypothetical protein